MSRYGLLQVPQTHSEALHKLTVDHLKALAKRIPSPGNIPQKKQELVDYIVRRTAGDSFFDNFSALQKKVLAEIAHCAGGIYHRGRMAAKYGQEYSECDQGSSWSLLDVIIIDKMVSQDICGRIRNIFPRPEIDLIQSEESLPREIRYEVHGSNGKQIDVIPLDERCTEFEALQNLEIVLRCIESGKIKISAISRCPTGASITMLAGQLACADWYEEPSYDGIQTFAWPLLLQAAGFAAASASSLSITAKGKNILSKKIAAHDAIKIAWDSWKSKALVDEFSRIDTIKGQKAKGRVMTSASQRRATVITVLSDCPTGRWISIEELGRYMRAENKRFEVTHDPWKLYISDKQYGALGYNGYATWEVLQERYIKVLLFEYAATLGIIDIGYVPPEDVDSNYSDIWGTDDLEFLSRYDGLLFFRVTELGAYVFGKSGSYTPSMPEIRKSLNVLPNFDIVITNTAELTKTELMYLDKIAMRESECVWKLSPVSLRNSFESGEDVDSISTFLEARAIDGIPQTVEVMLQDANTRIAEFAFEGRACLLECKNRDLLHQIHHDLKLKQYAIVAEPSFVTLLPGRENDFFQRLRALGYSVPVAEKIVS